jgi:hypothetical protein
LGAVLGVIRYTLRLPSLDEFKLVIAVAVYVLFIQAVPVVVTAFEEDVIANRNNRCIITVSLHTPDSNLSKYDCIAELPANKKVSFIDEADFGAHTRSSKQRLEILDPALTILMTGTAIERATIGYDTNAFVQWSYFDMLMVQHGIHPVLETLTKVA